MIELAAQFRFWTADLSGISDAMIGLKSALQRRQRVCPGHPD